MITIEIDGLMILMAVVGYFVMNWVRGVLYGKEEKEN